MNNLYYINIHDVKFDWTTDDGIEPTFEETVAIRQSVLAQPIAVPVSMSNTDLGESIADAISNKTGWAVLDFEYNIYGVGEKQDV